MKAIRRAFAIMLVVFGIGGALSFVGAPSAHARDGLNDTCASPDGSNNGGQVNAVHKYGPFTGAGWYSKGYAACKRVGVGVSCNFAEEWGFYKNGTACPGSVAMYGSRASSDATLVAPRAGSFPRGDCTAPGYAYGIYYIFCPNWTWVATQDLGGFGYVTSNTQLITDISTAPLGLYVRTSNS